MVGVLFGACASRTELAAIEILNRANCEHAQNGLALVSYHEIAALRGSTLIGITEPEPSAPPDILLLSISRGPQPTAGYGLVLRDALLEEGIATLHVEWRTPDADSAQAQMITSPCLVVGLEPGAFTRVRALDQHGVVIGETGL
jgi:hypothetical protein